MKYVNRNKTHTHSLKYTDVGQDHGILEVAINLSSKQLFHIKIFNYNCKDKTFHIIQSINI